MDWGELEAPQSAGTDWSVLDSASHDWSALEAPAPKAKKPKPLSLEPFPQQQIPGVAPAAAEQLRRKALSEGLYEPGAAEQPEGATIDEEVRRRMAPPDIAGALELENPYAKGVANTASALISPENSLLAIGTMLAPPLVGALAGAGFTVQMAAGMKEPIKDLQTAWLAKDWNKVKERATELGLSSLLLGAGLHGVAHSVAGKIRPTGPKPVLGEVISPESKAALESVKTPAGDTVIPNAPAPPELDAAVSAKLERMGADLSDPQHTADVIADAKGVPRAEVKVGEVPVSQTDLADVVLDRPEQAKPDQGLPFVKDERPGKPTVTLAPDAGPTALVHELAHAAGDAVPEDNAAIAASFLSEPEPSRAAVLGEKLVPGLAEFADEAAYRGMTQDEFDATVGSGKGIRSTQRYSVPGEGTSFSVDPETAESYVNFGRDDPRKTGKPTYVVEVRGRDAMVLDRDGYLKAQDEIPPERIARIRRFEAKGDDLVATEITRPSTVGAMAANPLKNPTMPQGPPPVAPTAPKKPFPKRWWENEGSPAFKKYKAAFKGVVQLLDPRVGVPEESLGIVGRMMGARTRSEATLALNTVVQAAEKRFDALVYKDPRVAQVFVDAVKQGAFMPEAWMQPVADMIKKTEQNLFIEKAKYKPEIGWIEDHFRAIWASGPEGEFGMNAGEGARPLEGSMSSFHHASGLGYSELMAKGYVPRYPNPITMWKHAVADDWKFISAARAYREAKDGGALKFINFSKESPPAEWQRIDAKFSRFADEGERGINGAFYAEPGLARLLNNVVSSNAFAENTILGGITALKAQTTAVELALALPHAFNMVTITSAVEMGDGAVRAINQGAKGVDTVGAGARLAEAGEGSLEVVKGMMPGLAAAHYIELGNKLFRVVGDGEEYLQSHAGLELAKKYPQIRHFVDKLFENGMVIRVDETSFPKIGRALAESWDRAEYGKVASTLLGSLHMASKPLFQLIRATKLAFAFENYGRLMADNADKLGRGEVTENQLARRAVDASDNHFGMVPYDQTWFWDRTFKGAMQLFIRAPGWVIGSLKTGAGGVAHAAMDLSEPLQVLRKFRDISRPADLIPRVSPEAAVIGGALVTQAVWASIIQFTHTGTLPSEPLDFYAPKVGGKDDRGHDNRVTIFGYPKEWVSWATHPLTTAGHKFAGLYTRLIESMQNKDFYGVQVWNPDDPKIKNFFKGVVHAIPEMFLIGGSIEALARGQGASGVVLNATGSRPAPASLQNTKAEGKIDQIFAEKRTSKAIDFDTFENRQKQHEWIKMIRNKDAAKANAEMVEAKAGVSVMRKTHKLGQMDPKVSRFALLTWKEMGQVWDLATPEEQSIFRPLLIERLQNALPRIQSGAVDYPQREMELWKGVQQKLVAPAPP